MTAWMNDAACQDVDDIDVMFPTTADGETVAKAICATCPPLVRAACLDHAISTGERLGVFGGLTPKERWPLRRQWIADRGLELTVTGRVKQGHGTRSCYQRGCRLEACREAQRAYEQARRA